MLNNILKKAFILPIVIYKKLISPLFPRMCKYYPSCSTYAIQSIQKFGVVRGLILAIWRLLRCNPWSNGGVDYVPDKFGLYFLKNRKDT